MKLTEKTIERIRAEYRKQWEANDYPFGVGGLEVYNDCFGDHPAIVVSNGATVCDLEDIGKLKKEIDMLYKAITHATGIEF